MSKEEPARRPDLRCPRCGAANPHARRFCGDCGADLQKPSTEAERRYLTVMFCDLVGSTALSEQLDPEELSDVILAYREVVAAAVSRYGGYVARYVGDGILIYFGYPKAHGDDPTRAVYAGLHILDGIERLSGEPHMSVRLRVRLGVHTGLVVVGDLARGNVREQDGVLGETPNLAARLMALTPENGMCVTGVTQSLIVHQFECADLGACDIPGLSRPIPVYRVMGARPAPVGGFAHVMPSTMVGRRRELAALKATWERTVRGKAHAMAVTGEPGIGKSRLIRAFADSLSGIDHQRIVLGCSPYLSNSAFHPIIAFLNRWLENSGGDKLARLAEIVTELRMPAQDVVPMLAAMLSLPVRGYRLVEASAALQRGTIINFFSAWLSASARRQPALIVVEDVQWADASTLELAGRLMAEAQALPVMMLFAYRLDAALPRTIDAEVLHLDRLSSEDAHELIGWVAAERQLPGHIVDEVAKRSDGVPLFVEELTKAVLELPRPAPAMEASNQHDWDIPISLHATLMSRLDSLDSAKAVAQRASVLGREFSYELIAAACGIPKPELDRGLAQLVDAQLLFESGSPPASTYTFKHSMIQETAYRSLLRTQRRALHGRIARTLESSFSMSITVHPELVAHHFSSALEPVRAAPYWRKAGEQALARSANIEACAHIRRGLADLAAAEESSERMKEEALLQIALGSALSALKGSAAPEVEQTYARAEEMCRKLDDPQHLFPALRGLQSFYLVHGPLRTARRMVEQLLQMADAGGDQLQIVEARRRLGWCLFCMGRIEAGRESLLSAIELYDRTRSTEHIVTFGSDPGVIGLVNLAWLEWFAGRPGPAVAFSEKAIGLSRELSYKLGMAYALGMSAALHQCLGEPSVTEALAQETLDIARRHDFPYWSAWQSALHGWSLAARGEHDEGMRLLESGLQHYRGTGAELFGSHILGMHASVLLRAGQPGRALELCDAALASSNRTDAHFYDAEIHRIEGHCILERDSDVDGAMGCFEEASMLARSQGARMLELRASLSMAEALLSAGRAGEAEAIAASAHAELEGTPAVADFARAAALMGRSSQENG